MNKTIFRRTKLINPGLQLRLVLSFVGLATLGMLLQFLFLGYRLTHATAALDGGGGELGEQIPGMLLALLGISMVVLLPIVFAIGILLTFRIAGPTYRFEQFLRSVARGEQIGPCKIRDGDELQSLCDVINEVTEPLRRRTGARDEGSEPGAERTAR